MAYWDRRYWDPVKGRYVYKTDTSKKKENTTARTPRQIYEDSLKTNYKGFAGSGETSSKKEKENKQKAVKVQKKTASDWSQSKSGAQGQAYDTQKKTEQKAAAPSTRDMDRSISFSFKKANAAVKNTPKSKVEIDWDNLFKPIIYDRDAEKKSIGSSFGKANVAQKPVKNGGSTITGISPSSEVYETNNGNVANIGLGDMFYAGNYTIDFVKEKNRDEALDKIGVLNVFLDDKLAPLYSSLKDAKAVNCNINKAELTIKDKRNEVIRKSSENVSMLYNTADVLNVATEVLKDIPVVQLGAVFTAFGQYIPKLIAENMDNSKTDDALKKYTGYDKQGDRIGNITKESCDLQYSNNSAFGESTVIDSKIVYEYHTVNGIRRMLNITINGKEVYNNYQNQ